MIQARVRAGSTAELISAETGWPLDRVIRFAEPPIAERGYIVQRAQAVELRRTGTPVTLADTVAQALAEDGLTNTELTWDAWRREDGKWIVTAAFTGARSPMAATWTYDSAGRNLHPLDEMARRLMGVSTEPIIDFITENPVAVVDEPVAEVTELRPHLVSVPALVSTADPISETELPDLDGQTTLAIPRGNQGSSALSAATKRAEKRQPDVDPAPAAKAKPKPKARRSSVPSWDEILFGATRGEDS